ncbi:tetratricopeptide repeat protein [Mucilaginibacter sp. McL0603]|uniref:tetratricopeptide repeat protein n=1 Tax=Mucilaginibacter sp. McL0603 TaxID=3415670 RepID=UPI003CF5D9E6
MKPYHKLSLIILFLFIGTKVFSQINGDAKRLVKEGVALNDSGKYDEAIDKYNQAIKIDSRYESAYYEMGFTLFSSGKGKEAIPYLIKVVALNPQSAGAFDLLGSIYDDLKDPDKAIDYFKQGIKADSSYQRLHFNLAITYYRQGKFTDAEVSAINAIKLDPKHASSQRVYAMATYKEGKRACSLLGWNSFLLLEPRSKRSAEALAYIKNILNYGITKTGEKSITVNVPSTDLNSINLGMQMAVVTACDNKKNISPADSLTLQLTSVFQIIGEQSDKLETPFFSNYYAKYFQKLSISKSMPAFVRYISLSMYKDENTAWFKRHDDELKDLEKWVSLTKRGF